MNLARYVYILIFILFFQLWCAEAPSLVCDLMISEKFFVILADLQTDDLHPPFFYSLWRFVGENLMIVQISADLL